MADLIMCYGEGCDLAEKCLRHIRPPCPEHQSRFVFAPHENGGTRCAYYAEPDPLPSPYKEGTGGEF